MNLKFSKLNSNGEAPWVGGGNVQQPTFNTQCPPGGIRLRRNLGCWMLSVGCWVFYSFTTFPAFAQPTNRGNPRDFSAFQIINDRNIFDPNRRPRVMGRNPTPRAPQIVDSFSLVGTMSYSNVLLAFFEGTSGDFRKSVPVGGKIANYTAKEIRQDAVKLAFGTNEIDLKVGMQMRRSEDGTWTPAEGSGGGSNAYPSGDRARGDSRNSRSFSRTPSASSSEAADNSPAGLPDPSQMPAPPDTGNLDPNDPVARLMLRRLQEENGGQPVRVEPTPAEPATGNPDNAPVPAAQPPDETNQNIQPNGNENRN